MVTSTKSQARKLQRISTLQTSKRVAVPGVPCLATWLSGKMSIIIPTGGSVERHFARGGFNKSGQAQNGGWFAFARLCSALLAFPNEEARTFRSSGDRRPFTEPVHRHYSYKQLANTVLWIKHIGTAVAIH
jgi:hypothetical protein